MAVHVPEARCRRRSASRPIIAQSLIWASAMIGSAILLRGTAAEDGVMLILLAGAGTSILLISSECRRTAAGTGGDGEPLA